MSRGSVTEKRLKTTDLRYMKNFIHYFVGAIIRGGYTIQGNTVFMIFMEYSLSFGNILICNVPWLAGFVHVDKTKRLKPGFNRPVQNLLCGQKWTKLDKTSIIENLVHVN